MSTPRWAAQATGVSLADKKSACRADQDNTGSVTDGCPCHGIKVAGQKPPGFATEGSQSRDGLQDAHRRHTAGSSQPEAGGRTKAGPAGRCQRAAA